MCCPSGQRDDIAFPPGIGHVRRHVRRHGVSACRHSSERSRQNSFPTIVRPMPVTMSAYMSVNMSANMPANIPANMPANMPVNMFTHTHRRPSSVVRRTMSRPSAPRVSTLLYAGDMQDTRRTCNTDAANTGSVHTCDICATYMQPYMQHKYNIHTACMQHKGPYALYAQHTRNIHATYMLHAT